MYMAHITSTPHISLKNKEILLSPTEPASPAISALLFLCNSFNCTAVSLKLLLLLWSFYCFYNVSPVLLFLQSLYCSEEAFTVYKMFLLNCCSSKVFTAFAVFTMLKKSRSDMEIYLLGIIIRVNQMCKFILLE